MIGRVSSNWPAPSSSSELLLLLMLLLLLFMSLIISEIWSKIVKTENWILTIENWFSKYNSNNPDMNWPIWFFLNIKIVFENYRSFLCTRDVHEKRAVNFKITLDTEYLVFQTSQSAHNVLMTSINGPIFVETAWTIIGPK